MRCRRELAGSCKDLLSGDVSVYIKMIEISPARCCFQRDGTGTSSGSVTLVAPPAGAYQEPRPD